jgi:hypothetical protein
MTDTNNTDALLAKINKAVAEVYEAEKAHEKTHVELVSKSKIVGALLLEAKKRHPKVTEFDAFLKRVDGLKLSRAYDLMKLAGGRITDEQLRQEARDRQRKSRAKKKPTPSPSLPKPEPTPDTKPTHSVTSPHVTESLEQRKAEMAALDASAGERAAKERATKASARALAEFAVACRTWLPRITVQADRQEARNLVATLTCSKCREAA